MDSLSLFSINLMLNLSNITAHDFLNDDLKILRQAYGKTLNVLEQLLNN